MPERFASERGKRMCNARFRGLPFGSLYGNTRYPSPQHVSQASGGRMQFVSQLQTDMGRQWV